jgi:GMP synthase-like glutamine amidotransferase
MHVPFEGPGAIADWIEKKGHRLEYTRFYEKNPLPEASGVDLLIIMGGPMNVFDFHMHSWMQEEVEWVGDFIQSGKPVLGICLGAQIVAAALGEEVYPGPEKEIGWHKLQFLPSLGEFRIFKDLPVSRKVFHWHGDTFNIPKGATRIASSQLFPNQGFLFDHRVLALQFHLEVSPEDVKGMVENCGNELVEGEHIQTAGEILSQTGYFETNKQVLYQILDYLSALIS